MAEAQRVERMTLVISSVETGRSLPLSTLWTAPKKGKSQILTLDLEEGISTFTSVSGSVEVTAFWRRSWMREMSCSDGTAFVSKEIPPLDEVAEPTRSELLLFPSKPFTWFMTCSTFQGKGGMEKTRICLRVPPCVVCCLIRLRRTWEGEGETRPVTAEAADWIATVVVEGKVFASAMIGSV